MSTHSSTQVKWSPPPPNSLKVKFDGVTFKDIGGGGWFVFHTKHTQQKINGSTAFAIDNMFYVNFRI